MPHTDRTHCRVWRFSKSIIIAATEHLRFRIHLRVDFEANNDFQLQHDALKAIGLKG